MTIFLDTANVSELKERGALDVVDGVTTHPSLAVNDKRAFRPLVRGIMGKARGLQGPPGDGPFRPNGPKAWGKRPQGAAFLAIQQWQAAPPLPPFTPETR